jgi:hypothetical protein
MKVPFLSEFLGIRGTLHVVNFWTSVFWVGLHHIAFRAMMFVHNRMGVRSGTNTLVVLMPGFGAHQRSSSRTVGITTDIIGVHCKVCDGKASIVWSALASFDWLVLS